MVHSKFRAYESRGELEVYSWMSLLLFQVDTLSKELKDTVTVFRIREIRVGISPVSIDLGKLNPLTFKFKSVDLVHKC